MQEKEIEMVQAQSSEDLMLGSVPLLQRQRQAVLH